MTNRRTFISMAATAAGATDRDGAITERQGTRDKGSQQRGHDQDSRRRRAVRQRLGSGRPIILTHAWPLSSDCWEQHAVALAEAGYRVISLRPARIRALGSAVRWIQLQQLCRRSGRDHQEYWRQGCHAGGFSMGGGEIVRYLSRHGSNRASRRRAGRDRRAGAREERRNNPQGVGPAFFDGLKDNLRKDRSTFLSGLLRDVFYDVETSTKSAIPVSQAVLDWSMQMAMQASLLRVDRFGRCIRQGGFRARSGCRRRCPRLSCTATPTSPYPST